MANSKYIFFIITLLSIFTSAAYAEERTVVFTEDESQEISFELTDTSGEYEYYHLPAVFEGFLNVKGALNISRVPVRVYSLIPAVEFQFTIVPLTEEGERQFILITLSGPIGDHQKLTVRYPHQETAYPVKYRMLGQSRESVVLNLLYTCVWKSPASTDANHFFSMAAEINAETGDGVFRLVDERFFDGRLGFQPNRALILKPNTGNTLSLSDQTTYPTKLKFSFSDENFNPAVVGRNLEMTLSGRNGTFQRIAEEPFICDVSHN